MTPHDFIKKWRNGGDERRDAQPFFEDLCRLVGHPTPKEVDPDHKWFTYEYGATKASGGQGWADVWKKGFFGWEAKGTDRSLDRAYEQLKMYADALQNPPLLVVSDLKTIVIHTNFTNTVKKEIRFTVDDLADFETRQILDAVFNNPGKLKPDVSRSAITKQAAQKFTTLAQALRDRGHEPHPVAHFLNRLLFCMFAEDIGLLPDGLFTKMVDSSQNDPGRFEARSRELFVAMRSGGDVAFENIAWFNGGLFDDDDTLDLTVPELKVLLDACRLDWSAIDPSIFGTLFERGLDPDKRSQLGAHYTDPATIMKIVRPVVVAPWLDAWEAEKIGIAALMAKADIFGPTSKNKHEKAVKTKAFNDAKSRLTAFLSQLRAFTVLDPACGSGNFLFLALRSLKDIEHRVIVEAEALGLGRQFPSIGPANVKGIELNAYAAELARITVWIGEIQWMIQNGYGAKRDPILQPLDQIENRDALLNSDYSEAAWPEADLIVGNPPFIGDKKMVRELGENYTASLRTTYSGRVPGGADFVCYWFEKANDAIRAGTAKRAGLVGTNSIRGGKNREVLKHIIQTSRILDAWSDEEWINEGAAVRVSLVSFGQGDETPRLNGVEASAVFPDLTATTMGVGVDLTSARRLSQNQRSSFVGGMKKGPFDVPGSIARQWLTLPSNPNGLSNGCVVAPWMNGLDVTRRSCDMWIVDFGNDMPLQEAAMFEAPFDHVLQHVKPQRDKVRNELEKSRWWLHARPAPDLRAATASLPRFIGTARVAKHRLFVWLPAGSVIDGQIVVVARSDDTTLGILQSQLHEVWSLRVGTSLEDRPRYTPTTCFETFPFPDRLTPDVDAGSYSSDPRALRIAAATRALVDARDQWLNPPEWTERLPEVVPGFPDRIIAKTDHVDDLRKRTLTNLYNAFPTWLRNLHDELNTSVAAAYGWEWPLSDDVLVSRLLELNHQRSNQ